MGVWVLGALLFIVLALGAFLTHHIHRLARTTFTDRGVSFRRPWPLLGNVAEMMFLRKSFVELLCEYYDEFKEIG